MPLRTASTPATNVVATAPMPGIMTPSLPFAGSMARLWDFLSDSLLDCAADTVLDFASEVTSARAAFFAFFEDGAISV